MSRPAICDTGMILPGVALFDDAQAQDSSQPRVPPKQILLLRYGKTGYTKGEARDEYEFTPEDADKILSDFSIRQRDVVIDYEHQTMQNGKAPAAGWIESLGKTAEGLVGAVRYWTKEARRYLEEGEYRYFSPVLNMSKRRPLSLHSVALTNHPATHGLPALVTTDDADSQESSTVSTVVETPKESRRMENLKQIADALGVAVVALADASGPDEGATLGAVQAKIAELKALGAKQAEFLKLHDASDLDAVTGKIKGMVPSEQLTALNDRLALIDAERAVAAALEARKLTEAQREWAIGYAKDNPKGFSDFIAKAPVTVPAPAKEVVEALADKATDTLELTDEALQKQFKSNPRLVAEGFTQASYAAFRRAEAAGLVRIAKTTKPEQE